MTISPRSLADLIEASRLDTAKVAIVSALRVLLPDVTIVSHPGRLDVSEVLDRSVVAAPGIAVGWSRIRAPRDPEASFGCVVDWAAYIVVEDFADQDAKRRVERETLGHAIGDAILDILADPDASAWGIVDITPPAADPPPELRPLFTVREAKRGAAIYAVTWSQTLIDRGRAIMAGATPVIDPDDASLQFEDGEDAIPPEIRAIMSEEEV